jgi:hypothetical protein
MNATPEISPRKNYCAPRNPQNGIIAGLPKAAIAMGQTLV